MRWCPLLLITLLAVSIHVEALLELASHINETIFTVNNPICVPIVRRALLEFNVSYMMQTFEHYNTNSTLSISPRDYATMMLSRAAILFPSGGDFVESGRQSYRATSHMVRALQDFDECGRKLYAFDFAENENQKAPSESKFLVTAKGKFTETIARSAVKGIALLRMDGELFRPLWDAINGLYDKVLPGGYIYIHNYGNSKPCRDAVDKFRSMKRIFEPMKYVRESSDDSEMLTFRAVWWQKRRPRHVSGIKYGNALPEWR